MDMAVNCSGIMLTETGGDRMGDRLGEGLLTGSPVRPCSNMEMRDPVGAIDPESTTSPLDELAVPTLVFLRGVRALGLGLALLLAASVAAMKLALLGSALAGVNPG